MGYVLSVSKAGNTWRKFQNDKFYIDTEGTELLPTMTHNYDITGHNGLIWELGVDKTNNHQVMNKFILPGVQGECFKVDIVLDINCEYRAICVKRLRL